MFQRRALLKTLGASALVTALPSHADTFPSKLVKMVPFGTAGGPIDKITRIYGEKLAQRWSQPVVVEPRPGASGILAAGSVARAPADGYTVMVTLPITHINNAILQPKLPYDAVKDFAPVTVLGIGGPMLVARPDAPFNNVREFIEFAKKQTRGVTYGTWGNGSGAHLYGELLQRESGANLIHTAYKGEAAAHNDMFAGILDVAWANPSTARNFQQAGKMKILGLAASRRLSFLANVPTFGEQGFKGFDVDSWIGVYAPAKTPPVIVEQWALALREITATPEVAAKLSAFGFEPTDSSPAQFAARQSADYPRVAALIKAAGVTAD